MTQNELREKVISAEGKVAKCAATLKKHREQLDKLVKKGADEIDIQIKQESIESATKKVEDAKRALANWKAKLDKRVTDDDRIEANTPVVVKDFLENWKQRAIVCCRERLAHFIEYRDELKAQERAARLEALHTLPTLVSMRELYAGKELTEHDLATLKPRKDVEAFLSERGLAPQQIREKLHEAGDQITLRMLEMGSEQEREAWLDKAMEDEKRAKMLDLISRIMSAVGTITDAAALHIGPDGDINGYITGTDGKAKVQTVGAGGHNIQCFHFRTLVHNIK